MGEGDNFPGCTAKPGADGEGLLGPTVRANGGDEMTNNSVSAGAERARSQPTNGLACGRACGPSCGKERSGAAHRGHARDGFSWIGDFLRN